MGARVRLKRRLLGWRQQDLAARSGLTQHFISQVETGSVACSDESRRRIASALDEDEAVILRGAPGVLSRCPRIARKSRICATLLAAYLLARLSRLRDRSSRIVSATRIFY